MRMRVVNGICRRAAADLSSNAMDDRRPEGAFHFDFVIKYKS